jgi:hypothetical protein
MWMGRSAVFLLALATAQVDARVLGGSDCYLVFEDVTNTRGKRVVDCQDGAACDTDGQVDDNCTFSFRLCVMQPGVPGCAPPDVTKIGKARLRKPPLPATAPACGEPNEVRVKVKKHKTIRLTAKSSARPRTDRDVLQLRCQAGAASPMGAFLEPTP